MINYFANFPNLYYSVMTHISGINNISSSATTLPSGTMRAIRLALCGLLTQAPGAEGDLSSGPIKTAQRGLPWWRSG